MEQNQQAPSPEWTEQYYLAKIILNKYGALHEFHVLQLQYYIIGCCNISLAGTFSLSPEKRTLSFSIQTERNYNKKKKELVKLKKKNPKISIKKHKEEMKIAQTRLDNWCKKLLWDDIKVELTFE